MAECIAAYMVIWPVPSVILSWFYGQLVLIHCSRSPRLLTNQNAVIQSALFVAPSWWFIDSSIHSQEYLCEKELFYLGWNLISTCQSHFSRQQLLLCQPPIVTITTRYLSKTVQVFLYISWSNHQIRRDLWVIPSRNLLIFFFLYPCLPLGIAFSVTEYPPLFGTILESTLFSRFSMRFSIGIQTFSDRIIFSPF